MRSVLAVLLLGQSLDALTFVLFYRLAPASFLASPYERNPIVAFMLAAGGVALVATVKVGLGSLTFVTGTHRVPRPRWLRLPAPAWLCRFDTATRLYRLALRNVMLVIAAASGFVGALFNLRAVAMVLA